MCFTFTPLVAVAALLSILAAHEPAARSWRLGSEVEGATTDAIVRELGLEVGTRRVYRNLYRTHLGTGAGQIGTVRWTSISRVVEHVETPVGLVVLIEITERNVRREYEGNPPPEDVEQFEQELVGRLIPGYDRAGYLVRDGYVYELPDGSWNRQRRELWDGFAERLPHLYPDYFFPLSDGLRWSEPATEERDLAALRAFETGDGPAPNSGNFYWVAGCSPFDGDPPDGVLPICWYDNTGTIERWIEPGVGLVREMYSHHGTLIEWEIAAVLPKRHG
jgi:hypothetical protein